MPSVSGARNENVTGMISPPSEPQLMALPRANDPPRRPVHRRPMPQSPTTNRGMLGVNVMTAPIVYRAGNACLLPQPSRRAQSPTPLSAMLTR